MTSILKKILSCTLALITSITFFSCGNMKDSQIKQNDVGKHMEEVLAKLLDSINNDEKETFKDFFSEDVLTLHDFENGYNFVFGMYQGDLLSISCNFPLGTGQHIVPNEHICYAFTTFDIVTSENEYVAFVEFYTQYLSKYPENSYKIRKFKILDKQSLDNGANFNDCTQRYGIYYPEWVGEQTN